MSKVIFKLNKSGVQELLQGEDMQSVLKQAGDAVAARAGTDYACDIHVFTKRAVAHVYPNSAEAAQDNYDNNTLLKAL